MNKIASLAIVSLLLIGCNPTLNTFTFIYTKDGPNEEIAKRMEKLLERSFYNVDIVLIEGESTNANLDSISTGAVDISLIENYVDYREGINSAFSVYSEVLHIFYDSLVDGSSFESLISNHSVFMGSKGSPTYNLMMDLFIFYGLDQSKIEIVPTSENANVIVMFSNLFTKEGLQQYDGYRLFSFEATKGISLKHPRISSFTLPESICWGFTSGPILTLSVDLIMIVRSGMFDVSVNDLTRTMLRNRQVFTSIDPLLFGGLSEDFDQGVLNIPLHEGARTFLDRDEPSFLERYAELGGVILSILIAITSGIISLTKWQTQKKKDEIDEFYEDLMNIKNAIPSIQTIHDAAANIRLVQSAQNKAFEMLIAEKLIANESFKIYMELSKEVIEELRRKIRLIRTKQERLST